MVNLEKWKMHTPRLHQGCAEWFCRHPEPRTLQRIRQRGYVCMVNLNAKRCARPGCEQVSPSFGADARKTRDLCKGCLKRGHR